MKIDLSKHVSWIAFGNNGTRIAIQDDCRLRICNYPQLETVFERPDLARAQCALSPNGRILVCGTYLWSGDYFKKVERQLIEVWDVDKNAVIGRIKLPHSRENPVSSKLIISHDNNWIAVVREDGLVVSIHIGSCRVTQIENPQERFFKSMPSGIFVDETSVLAYTYLDESIRLIELGSMRHIRTINVHDILQIFGYRITDNKILVVRYGKDDYDNQITSLDIETGHLIPIIRGKRGYLWSPGYTALSPNSKYIAALVFKETPYFLVSKPIHSIDIWDAYTGRLISETITDQMTKNGLTLSVFSLAFASDDKLFAGKSGSIERISISPTVR